MGPHSWIATHELEMKYVAYGEKAESLTFISSPENGCFRYLCLFHCSQFTESNNTECWEKLGKQPRNSEWSAPCHTSSSCPTAYHLPDNALGIRGGKNQKQTENWENICKGNDWQTIISWMCGNLHSSVRNHDPDSGAVPPPAMLFSAQRTSPQFPA